MPVNSFGEPTFWKKSRNDLSSVEKKQQKHKQTKKKQQEFITSVKKKRKQNKSRSFHFFVMKFHVTENG